MIDDCEKVIDKMPAHAEYFGTPQLTELTEHVVRSFQVAKQLCVTQRINAIDFSQNGDTMISGDSSEQIIVYDCDKSDQLKTINVRKYGVDLVRYTHDPNVFIHTSTKIDHNIRLMNEDTVTYLTYYRGHTDRVATLCISPKDDRFISGAFDRTLRLWEIRSNDCIGIMNLSGRPIAAFDPEGRIFAVGINSACIKLYDVQMFEKGPFVTFKMNPEENCEWIDLKFSPDGKVIMINTNGSIIRLIDAYNGTVLRTISGKFVFQNSQNVRQICLIAKFCIVEFQDARTIPP